MAEIKERLTKTKKQLIDVARELFALKGKKNITMNDIAEASKKGRRTIYTYFKNKDEIYKEVKRYELDLVIESLRNNVQRPITPYEKLKDHVFIHLDAIKASVTRNGTLRADFFKDIYEVERLRLALDREELNLLKQILKEGVDAGAFKGMNVNLYATILLYSLKGLEVPYIRDNIAPDFKGNKDDIVNFVLNGIMI